MASAPSTPLPEGFGVALDPSVRRLAGGRVLLGGTPPRLLRLTSAGAALVAAWDDGERPHGTAALTLARRLVEGGLAHPRPPAGSVAASEATIVVPVRDRPDQLRRCLAAIGGEAPVIVIDDGSRDSAAIATIARAGGATVVRHERSHGAAAARNTGVAACTTTYVAFVDSDCLPPAGWLVALLAHFADARVAAVAPRIVAAPRARVTWLARFEAAHSPLDMGAAEAPVLARTPVPYVPSAALVVRRAAIGAGFDPGLSIGEDVDLVWRIAAAGWSVRYDPSVAVAHDHRVALRPWLRRRCVYGGSVALLARRHPGALPAAALSPWSAAFWALIAARRPGAALLPLTAASWRLRRQLAGVPGAWPESARLAARGTAAGGRSLAIALTRTWLPLSAPAAIRSRRARRLLACAALVRLWELRGATAGLDLPRAALATVLDDGAYACGVWSACARERTADPLAVRVRA